MDVKITSDYSREEVLQLLALLVDGGVLTAEESAKATALTAGHHFRFFDVNDLLLPFVGKFVGYSKDEQSLARLTRNTDTFYQILARRLLDGCPLRYHAATCFLDSKTGMLTIRSGHISHAFTFGTLPEFEVQAISSINQLLKQHEVDAAYYEIGFDEHTAFLLLSERQYQHLLTHRALCFAQVEYPEIEAWRKTISLEDLPF